MLLRVLLLVLLLVLLVLLLLLVLLVLVLLRRLRVWDRRKNLPTTKQTVRLQVELLSVCQTSQ